jgi:hypothetical protein
MYHVAISCKFLSGEPIHHWDRAPADLGAWHQLTRDLLMPMQHTEDLLRKDSHDRHHSCMLYLCSVVLCRWCRKLMLMCLRMSGRMPCHMIARSCAPHSRHLFDGGKTAHCRPRVGRNSQRFLDSASVLPQTRPSDSTAWLRDFWL